jgi:hypothetical protein
MGTEHVYSPCTFNTENSSKKRGLPPIKLGSL